MRDEFVIEKAKKYLIRFKKSRLLKKHSEILEIQRIIEQLDSLQFRLKKEGKINNEIR